jgi:hypothetical protein
LQKNTRDYYPQRLAAQDGMTQLSASARTCVLCVESSPEK